jgi:protocatechuate 3,4-dioxygenase beta subunit
MRRWVITTVVVLFGVTAGWFLWLRPPPPAPTLESVPAAPLPEFQAVEVRSQSEGLTLSGVVRDPGGKPVRDAEVFLAASGQQSLVGLKCTTCGDLLMSCRARESAQTSASLIAANKGELSPGATARSDEHGEFRFEHLSGVSFTVWARAAGLGDGLKERAAPGDPVELYLPPLRSIVGRLRDEDGNPIAGNVVAISRRLAVFHQATADPQGVFELKGLGEGPFYLLAQAPDRLPSALPQVEAGPDPVKVTLLKPRRLEVTLTHGGKPVEGTVKVRGDHLTREVASGQGLGTFNALYPDRVMVTATAGSLSSAPHSVSLESLVTRINLELEEGGRISVTVIDETEQPVPEPQLELLTPTGELVSKRAAKTGELVAFGPLGQGDYLLRGSAAGFTSASVPVKVGTGEASVELQLQKGTAIAGRVLDEYGRPAPGVSVLITPTGDSVVSDSEGKFVAPVPSPGLYELHAHHSDWGGGNLKVTAPKTGVDLQLEPRAGAQVTVTVAGRRVEGASVVMYIEKEGSFRSDRPSSADGVVLMRGLPPGTYWLVASHSDFLPSDRQKVTIEEGVLAKIAAELKAGEAVSGTVVDEVGTPVSGVAVSVAPRGAEPTVTDTAGKFEIRPLRPKGNYVVRVTQRGIEQVDRVVAVAGGDPVKVVVKREKVFKGRVVSDSKPLKRFRIDDHDVESADGRFELPLPSTEDRVIFAVEAPGFEPLMVDRPATPDLGDLVLKAGPTLGGTVRDEGGAPVVDAVVGCDACEQSVRTDAEGRFSLGSPPFIHEFTVIARKGRRSGTRTVVSGSGPIEVVLKPGTQLSGRVWLPDGTPGSGVEIQGLHTDRSEPVSVVTGPDGSYQLDLPPGIYRFMVTAPGIARNALDPLAVISEVSGEQAHLDFGPAPGTSSLSVQVRPQRGYALWLVRGDLATVGNPPLELLRASYAHLVYQPLEDRVAFMGLAPGRYTLVWASFHAESNGGPIVEHVDVPGRPEVTLVR